MPTSSQALILIKCEPHPLLAEESPRNIPSTTATTTIPYPVSHVVLSAENISRFNNLKKNKIDPTITLLQPLTVKGFPGVLSYDNKSKSYKWKTTDQTEGSDDKEENATEADNDGFITNVSIFTRADEGPPNCVELPSIDPETGNVSEKGLIIGQQQIDELDKKLMELGFRRKGTIALNLQKLQSSPDSSVSRSPNGSNKSSPTNSSSDVSGKIVTAQSEPAFPTLKHKPPLRMEPTHTLREVEEILGLTRKKEITKEIIQSEEQKEAKALLQDPKWRQKLKKMKLHTVRLRKELPPLNALAVCILLPDDSLTHYEVAKLIQNEIGARVRTLKYDPVQIQVEDPDVGCRWIATFDSIDSCRFICHRGLMYHGEQIKVRPFDIVMREEFRAYQLVEAIQVEQQKLSLTTLTKKHPKKSKESSGRLNIGKSKAKL